MFENPQNAAQQIANLAERVATEMRVLLNTVLGKADKDHTHTAEQVTGLDEIYATKEDSADPRQAQTAFTCSSSGSSFTTAITVPHSTIATI